MRSEVTIAGDQLQAALSLARQGIPVGPLRSKSETLKNGKPRPAKSPKIADFPAHVTTDADQIRRWWKKWPDAMPGTATGPASGFAVLDLDQKDGKDGIAALRALGFDPYALSRCVVETPSGGLHLYFLWPEGLGCSAPQDDSGKPLNGVDVRGEGGVIALPGAVNGKGAYRLLSGALKAEELPEWPEALRPRWSAAEGDSGEPTGLPTAVTLGALAACPNNGDAYPSRESWVRMGMAVHCETEGSEEGREAWHDWSAQHPTYDRDRTDEAWDSFGRGRGPMATGWHIIREAQRHGWHDPAVTELRLMLDRERQLSAFADMPEGEPGDWREGLDAEGLALIGGDPEQGDPPFFIDMADMLAEAAPPREWHVQDWIPAKTVHMLMGDGGTGKSLLGIQLAVATGTGGEWLGHKISKPGVALYYGAEDDRDELHRRFADVCRGLDVDAADHRGRVLLRSAVAEDTVFATVSRNGKVQPTKVLKMIEREIAAARPSLVVLDTLANLHALDPNSQEQAKAFVGLLIGIAKRHGCAFVLLAHPSRTGMASGDGDGFSVGWSNAVRSRSYLAPDPNNPDLAVLSLKKTNYGKPGLAMKMEWQDGVFVKVNDEYADASTAKTVFLEILDRLTREGRFVSASTGANYAPSRFAEEPEAEAAGLSKDQLARAMRAMLKAKILRMEDYQKTDRKPGKRLARGDYDLPNVQERFTDDLV